MGATSIKSDYVSGINSLPINPSSQFLDSNHIVPIHPVKRNDIESDFKDFGTHKYVSNLCPDIMTVISHLVENDIGPVNEVHLFCKTSGRLHPDDGYSDSIIENSKTDLIYSNVLMSTYHDYMLSFVGTDSSITLFSLNIDSNILEMQMFKDLSGNIYIPNISSLDDLICDFPELNSCLIYMNVHDSKPYTDIIEDICNSEMYLNLIKEVTSKLNSNYKFLINNDTGYTIEYRPILKSIYDCDDSGYITYNKLKEELSDTIAMLTESEEGINVTLYTIGFDNQYSSPGVILSPKSSYLILKTDFSKETLDFLIPKESLMNHFN